MKIGEMFVEVDADLTGLTRGLAKAQTESQIWAAKLTRQLGTVEGAAKKSHLSMGKLGQELTTAARMATNTSPIFAQLGKVVGEFALGSGLMIGVLGGIAALGLAWEKVTKPTKAYEEALKGVSKELDELVRKRAFGGQLDLLDRKNAALTEIASLRQQRRGPEKDLAEAQFFRNAAAIKKAQAALEAIDIEIATWERRVVAADRALQDAIPTIDGFTGSVDKLTKKAKLLATDPFGLVRAERDAQIKPREVLDPLHLGDVFKKLQHEFGAPSAAGSFGGVSSFEAALDGFGSSINELIDATFSPAGLASMGSALALSLSGKFVSELGGLFSGVDRLAQAMEQNTKALQADSDFLAKLLEKGGLTEQASKIEQVLSDTINRIATNRGAAEGSLIPGLNVKATLTDELAKANLQLQDLQKLAALLGIDFSVISQSTLNAFDEQLQKATSHFDDMGDAVEKVTGSLLNVPSILKVEALRFDATRAATIGASTKPATATGAPTVVIHKLDVLLRRGGLRELLTELQAEARRVASTGGQTFAFQGEV